MPSDDKRLSDALRHIERIREGSYPVVVGQDRSYRIVERPWGEMPERSKLAILQDAVDWTAVSNRDQGHILLSEVDPGKISDAQRNRLINMAVEEDGYSKLIQEKADGGKKRSDTREQER